MLLPCLYSFVACAAYCLCMNLRGPKMLSASWGGALGWLVYLAFGFTGNDIFQYFTGALAVSVYAEIMARVHKTPVTGLLLVSLLPMFPGGGIYHTMEYAVSGDMNAFLDTGLHTFGIAGTLAMGVLLVSSTVRLWHNIRAAHTAK